jgi:hypothetical protein
VPHVVDVGSSFRMKRNGEPAGWFVARFLLVAGVLLTAAWLVALSLLLRALYLAIF